MTEIWLLQRMVKLSVPIAGETGDADNLDGSRCGAWGARLGERRTPHFFWGSGSRTRARKIAIGLLAAPMFSHPEATGGSSAGGDRSHCGRDRPPAAAAVRGAASNLTSITCALYSVY